MFCGRKREKYGAKGGLLCYNTTKVSVPAVCRGRKGYRVIKLSDRVLGHVEEANLFVKWLLYACFVGGLVGVVGVAFHHGIDWAAEFRAHAPEVVWLLPAGGVAVVFIYRLCYMLEDRGTNLVLAAARGAERLKLRTAPLIFIATIVTHLVGGSAGREGAALQLGGSLAAYVGRKIRLDAKDSRVMVMCGMAAAFTALFGTPLAATVFAMEVASVGVMHYAAIVPCTVASLTAFLTARFLGLHDSVGYEIGAAAELTAGTVFSTVILGVLCAILAVWFCKAMHAAPHWYQKHFASPELRALLGGAFLLVLTMMVGSQDYNGAGDPVIRRMLAGETIYAAFLLKILFTAVTLGAGFRGGEIVPVLFTGCAFGTLMAPVLGLPHGFAGALAMAALFCGTTNCPLSSILLAFELFGGESLPLFALCCGVSYMLSGYYSLYSEQKIMYSKFKTEWIDRKAK